MKTKTFNVSVGRKQLLDAVKLVAPVASNRSTIAILSHVRLKVADNRLSVMASDMTMWVERRVFTGGMLDAGGCTLPAKSLNDLLSAMPEGEVSLTRDGGNVKVKLGKSNYSLLCLDAEEFPLMPNINTSLGSVTIPGNEIANGLSQVMFAASDDVNRAVITGILFAYDSDSNVLKLVATDTHRLAVKELHPDAGSSSGFSAIVPKDACIELLKLIGNSDSPVMLEVSEVQFKAVVINDDTDTVLISRVIEGQYPNYERVIPRDSNLSLTIPRLDLASVLRRVQVVGADNAHKAVFTVSEEGKSLRVTSESGNVGSAEETVAVSAKGWTEEFQIGFNSKYFQETLAAIEAPNITLSMTDPLRPGLVRGVDDYSYLCVVMPMQVV